jgi:hypothetical protein
MARSREKWQAARNHYPISNLNAAARAVHSIGGKSCHGGTCIKCTAMGKVKFAVIAAGFSAGDPLWRRRGDYH